MALERDFSGGRGEVGRMTKGYFICKNEAHSTKVRSPDFTVLDTKLLEWLNCHDKFLHFVEVIPE